MSLVFYLVAPTLESGLKAAAARGWSQVARARFVSGAQEDIRLICRFSELVPLPGEPTRMLRAPEWDGGSGLTQRHELERWQMDKERFEDFVRLGGGVWVEDISK